MQSRPAPALLAVTLAGTLAACALPYAGALAGALGLVAPPAEVYLLIASCVAGYVMLVSIMKGAYVRRRGSQPTPAPAGAGAIVVRADPSVSRVWNPSDGWPALPKRFLIRLSRVYFSHCEKP